MDPKKLNIFSIRDYLNVLRVHACVMGSRAQGIRDCLPGCAEQHETCAWQKKFWFGRRKKSGKDDNWIKAIHKGKKLRCKAVWASGEWRGWRVRVRCSPRATLARAVVAAEIVSVLKSAGSSVVIGVGFSSLCASFPMVILNTSSSSSLRNTVLFPTV